MLHLTHISVIPLSAMRYLRIAPILEEVKSLFLSLLSELSMLDL